MSDDNDDLKDVAHKEHLTFFDRMRAQIHPITDRADSGQVTYPRREYLQHQANMRKAAHDMEQRRKGE